MYSYYLRGPRNWLHTSAAAASSDMTEELESALTSAILATRNAVIKAEVLLALIQGMSPLIPVSPTITSYLLESIDQAITARFFLTEAATKVDSVTGVESVKNISISLTTAIQTLSTTIDLLEMLRSETLPISASASRFTEAVGALMGDIMKAMYMAKSTLNDARDKVSSLKSLLIDVVFNNQLS